MAGSFLEVTVTARAARGRVRPEIATALCAGHFPGDPLLPGAQLAGLMAELATLLVAAGAAPHARVRAIDHCVFRSRVRPDAPIVVTAHVLSAENLRVETAVDTPGGRAAHALLRFGAPP